MTETATAEPTTTDEDVEAEALAADETPLATSQAAHLTEVLTWTDDERRGLWGQPLK